MLQNLIIYSVLSVSFDSLVPTRLTLRANLRLLYLKGPAFSVVVMPLELCLKAILPRPWLKNGSGEDADPLGFYSTSANSSSVALRIAARNKDCSFVASVINAISSRRPSGIRSNRISSASRMSCCFERIRPS